MVKLSQMVSVTVTEFQGQSRRLLEWHMRSEMTTTTESLTKRVIGYQSGVLKS